MASVQTSAKFPGRNDYELVVYAQEQDTDPDAGTVSVYVSAWVNYSDRADWGAYATSSTKRITCTVDGKSLVNRVWNYDFRRNATEKCFTGEVLRGVSCGEEGNRSIPIKVTAEIQLTSGTVTGTVSANLQLAVDRGGKVWINVDGKLRRGQVWINVGGKLYKAKNVYYNSGGVIRKAR